MSIVDDTTPRDSAHRQVASLLMARGVSNAAHEARLIVQHALGLSATDLALGRRTALGEAGAEALREAVRRRLDGEPLARIVEAWEFWSLPFALSPDTLVPRPDTETLVERALAVIGDRTRALTILDLGTGSGCVLVALLSELPSAFGIGTDRSLSALQTARRNAAANGVGERAAFLLGDWSAALAGPFDLIVSNPPYIASAAIPDLAVEVREHDPRAALDGGPDGLAAYRAIIADIASRPNLLTPDGAVLLEVGFDQAEAVARIGTEAGLRAPSIDRDLAGHARVVTLRPPFAATPPSQKSIDD